MTRRLGGIKKSLAAIASVSLAVTLACVGATGCGSSTSNNAPPPEAGSDVISIGFDAGEDSPSNQPETAPPVEAGPIEAAPPLVVLGTPTFMPASGTVLTGPTNVTIVAPANLPASGFIYYTTNGTNPNPNSLVYSGPIQVSQNETIRAYASAPGFMDSMVGVATYTVSVPPVDAGEAGTTGPLAEPAFSPTSSVQNNDFKVAASGGTGTTICYTLDGVTTPTCSASGACTGSSLQYNSVTQIAINGGVTSSTGTVLVQAITCEAGAATSGVATQSYTLQVAAPFFSNPAEGTVLLGVTPIVQSTTTGATIAYTKGTGAPTCINGTAGVGTAVSDPHTFAGADALNASTTYQTIGCKAGYAPSTVSTSPFVVQLNALTFPTAATTAPGTFDANVPQIQFGNALNGSATATQWACYTLDGTAPTCGATASTCSANATVSTAGLATVGGTVPFTKAVSTVTVIDCAVGYTASATAMGVYTLMLDAPDLTPPGVANGAPVTSYPIPANMVGSLTATVGQNGTGQAYGFVCVLKGATPQCGAGACTTGTQVALGATIPPTGTIAPGDSWSVIGCPAQTINFLPSAVTTVSFSGPGVASAPQIAPGSGTFANPIAPTITNTDTTAGGTTICYTEDGTQPACSNGACTHGTSQANVPAAGAADITTLNLMTGGTGYTTAPAVTLSGGGATTQAIVSATLSASGYTLTNAGSGYTTPTNCVPVFDAAGTVGATGAYVDVVISSTGTIASLAFDGSCGGATNNGEGGGYVSPTITLPGPSSATGTQATATITGTVSAIIITTNASDYATPPTIAFSGGGGSGAAASAVTSNGFQATALSSNLAGVLNVTACNATESQVGVISDTYAFTLAEPDVTSVGGATGNLNAASTVNAGQTICVTTTSNFTGNADNGANQLNITYGATAVNCGSGLPAGATKIAASGSACPIGAVQIVVPSNAANFTVNAIACGTNTTTQNSSIVRSAAFETVTTAPPVITTNQTVVIAGVAGCQPGNTGNQAAGDNCAPVTTWYNPFDVFIYDATASAQICYSTTATAPSCNAGGTCATGTPYTAGIPIATSGTAIQAIACNTTTGASSATTPITFTLEVSPVVAYAAGTTCGSGVDLGFYNSTNANTEVSDSVAAVGGATLNAVICYTVDGSAPGCTTGSGSNSSTMCASANMNDLDPTPASTADTGAITSTFTLNWQACLSGFQPNTGSQPVSSAPFVHSGAITLDGVLTDWNQDVEPNAVGGLTVGIGEGNNEANGKEGLFTYDAANLYFAYDDIFSDGANDATVIYVGNGAAGGATQAPPTLGSTFIGLPAAAGVQYAISWLVGAGNAPAVQQWIQGTGWTPVSITVNAGYSVANDNVEFSVPIASLPAITTPGTITVIETEVDGAGAAFPGSRPIDSTLGSGTVFHGFKVNTMSCLEPNAQLF